MSFDLKNNITKLGFKKIKNEYVYLCKVDGRLTIYITKSLWNYKLTIKLVKGEFIYKDGRGNIIEVYEDDDNEYHNYIKHFIIE